MIKATKEKYLREGRCHHCKEHYRLVKGHKLCRACLKKARKQYAKGPKYRKKYRAEYGVQGKCWKCKEHVSVAPGMTLCRSCARKNRDYLRKLKSNRKAKNACLKCGKKLLNLKYVHCKSCRKYNHMRSKKYMRKIYKNHKTRKKYNAKIRARKRFIREEVYMAYGGLICRCCGRTDIESLQLDHVNNDGANERRKLKKKNKGASGFLDYLYANNFPDKERYQVLCASCNMRKRMLDGNLDIKFDWSKARFMSEKELISGLSIYNYAQLDSPMINFG